MILAPLAFLVATVAAVVEVQETTTKTLKSEGGWSKISVSRKEVHFFGQQCKNYNLIYSERR